VHEDAQSQGIIKKIITIEALRPVQLDYRFNRIACFIEDSACEICGYVGSLHAFACERLVDTRKMRLHQQRTWMVSRGA